MLKLTPKPFWLLVLTLLSHWHKISKLYLVPVPNCWTWIMTIFQKSWFFWSNPYKIDQLCYVNFSHKNARVTKLWSHDSIYNIIWVTKFFYWRLGQILWRHKLYFKIPFFKNSYSSRFFWYHQSCDHNLQRPKKVERIRNFVTKSNLCRYFLISRN